MRQRDWLPATLLSIACCGMAFVFCASIASPIGTTAMPPVRTAKCTIDIAAGKESDCTLIKASHEWILWSNSAPTSRSIHFKSDGNPFAESSCADVGPGARARSGPIALNAIPKTYVAYASDVACDSNPPSDSNHDTLKVIIQ
ncbi:MAG TPA: hypothetical protein VN884_03760 [Candidatus Sulfotelmatobacter sp.]|jgi:hypothetical protein|nr:hypothetical protein [Candidatus Sulfotelmatobacter sp.]